MATSPTTSSRQRSTREPAMGKRSRRPVSGRMVSASDLAQMGRCERLVVFEHLHGSRRTVRQQQARARGLVEHAQFYREGLAASAQAARKGRCLPHLPSASSAQEGNGDITNDLFAPAIDA